MDNNANLNPIVYDTEGDTSDHNRDKIFRPTITASGTDTVESHAMTSNSENNNDYYSVKNRNTKINQVVKIKEVESLRSIIDRLDCPGDEPIVQSAKTSEISDYQENDVRSAMTEEFNDVLSAMRVDMVFIIKLLQTLHSSINDVNSETDNIKGDIYNLVTAVGNIKDKLNEVNDNTIRRHQKAVAKNDGQISKICLRLEALERANFTTHEPVNRGDAHKSNNTRVQTKDATSGNESKQTESKSENTVLTQGTQSLNDAQSSLKKSNIRVKPKRDPYSKDHVGNNLSALASHGHQSRMANRSGKYEDTIERATIKTSKLSNRGIKDSVTKKIYKLRKDVIKKQHPLKNQKDGGLSDSSDESIETDNNETTENETTVKIFTSA
jgi:hypothetical protein